MIQINLKQNMGQIKPLNGVNNGPLQFANSNNIDKRREFREARIPFSRLHDTEGAYGSGVFVNIHCVFPNFDADVEDPASYYFDATDIYIQGILDAGTKVFYRLGETIENSRHIKIFVKPPKDYEKWARICEHIIMHYNEGWADGFHHGIEYWEIWNEPECQEMWYQATPEQYYELYHVTATHLKARFPELKIGGFASSGFYGLTRPNQDPEVCSWIPFAENFFQYITRKDKQSPLDFFSWHVYPFDPKEVGIHARFVDEMLRKYGFEKVENILNEWNYCDTKDSEDIKRRKNHFGAAMMVAVLAEMQKSPISAAMYYDAEIRRYGYCGIFDLYTKKALKPYYSLYYFGKLLDLGTEVYSSVDGENIFVIAAEKDGSAGILVSNFSYKSQEETIVLDHEATVNAVFATNATVTNAAQPDRFPGGKTKTLSLTLHPYEILYIALNV